MANKFIEAFRHNIINGIRVKPNKGKRGDVNTEVDDDLVEFLRSLDSGKVLEIVGVNNFRDISDNRGEQYDAFDEMEKDASIAAALKMYADDATQYNLDGNVIWVEAAEPNIAAFGNRLLQVLRINEKAWIHIYNLVKYGDIYLETFYDDEVDADSLVTTPVTSMYGTVAQSHKIGARIEEYVEMVPNPAVIFDLRKRGKTEGFIKLDDDDQDSNIQRVYRVNLSGTQQRVLPADKYIHIMLAEESDRFPESFDITFETESKQSSELAAERDVKTYRYTVAKGKSILFDVFKAYRELKLMEDSVLLNRVTRSAITRILQIEVGDMPKSQAKEKLRQIKMMIEQRNFMDANSGEFSNQASPGPVDNVIYVPTRNGNGAITMSSLGGDVDPKSLIDLEYFKQKLSGALGIPLAYLQGHCFRHNTKIILASGEVLTIKELYENRLEYIHKKVLSCDTTGTVQLTRISDIMLTRKDAHFVRVTINSGKYIDVTPDHRFMLDDGGFVRAEDLVPGTSLMSYSINSQSNTEFNLDDISTTESYIVTNVQVLDVCEDAYDIEVEAKSHSFALACGIFVHNSGDGGGLSSGTALTKLDNKYARTIKRIQTAYIQGITTLLNVFAIRKGLSDYVNAFTVRMVSPSTIEDDDRDQQLDNRINMMSNIVDMVSSSEAFTQEGKTELITYLTSTFLNKPEISKILQDNIIPPTPEEPEEPKDSDDDFTSSRSRSSNSTAGFDDFPSVDFSDFSETGSELDTSTAEPENTADADTGITPGEETGYGDFEEFA